jgi:hypothetical protein
MIGMAMSDHRPVHRPDRVDVEIAGHTIEARGGRFEQILETHHGEKVGIRGLRTRPRRIRTNE